MTVRRAKGLLAWRSGSAAVLALAALNAHRAPAHPGTGFHPPHATMLLSRTLVRSLPDGKSITTRREYQVSIVRSDTGFRVEGELVATFVDAPPSLQALAELERRRAEPGLFPMQLDAEGRIVDGGQRIEGNDVGQAATLVARKIGAAGLAPADRSEAQSFVGQVRSGAARSAWPADVFRPVPGKRTESRVIDLPGGSQGQVTIEIEAQAAGTSGQIALVDRVVTTEMGGDRRTTRERWQLSRAMDPPGR